MFPTRVRLSGMAIGTQIGFAIAGFAPSIAGTGIGGWVPVAAMTLIACVIAAIAASTARETAQMTLQDIEDAADLKGNHALVGARG